MGLFEMSIKTLQTLSYNFEYISPFVLIYVRCNVVIAQIIKNKNMLPP
jgi:hypothetical protein